MALRFQNKTTNGNKSARHSASVRNLNNVILEELICFTFGWTRFSNKVSKESMKRETLRWLLLLNLVQMLFKSPWILCKQNFHLLFMAMVFKTTLVPTPVQKCLNNGISPPPTFLVFAPSRTLSTTEERLGLP
jgi:hypothetical protein